MVSIENRDRRPFAKKIDFVKVESHTHTVNTLYCDHTLSLTSHSRLIVRVSVVDL